MFCSAPMNKALAHYTLMNVGYAHSWVLFGCCWMIDEVYISSKITTHRNFWLQAYIIIFLSAVTASVKISQPMHMSQL